MNKEEFLEMMIEILDTEETIDMNTKLDTLEEWDSLSSLMFQSQMFKLTKKQIVPKTVKEAETIADLYKLITEP